MSNIIKDIEKITAAKFDDAAQSKIRSAIETSRTNFIKNYPKDNFEKQFFLYLDQLLPMVSNINLSHDKGEFLADIFYMLSFFEDIIEIGTPNKKTNLSLKDKKKYDKSISKFVSATNSFLAIQKVNILTDDLFFTGDRYSNYLTKDEYNTLNQISERYSKNLQLKNKRALKNIYNENHLAILHLLLQMHLKNLKYKITMLMPPKSSKMYLARFENVGKSLNGLIQVNTYKLITNGLSICSYTHFTEGAVRKMIENVLADEETYEMLQENVLLKLKYI